MNSKLLTVVVPSYNVENTLSETLDSLLNAGSFLDQLDILVINDGSKDSTEHIALEYETRFPDIVKCVTKKNGGHGSTINRGIEIGRGKYFRVVDGDDWVDVDTWKSFLSKLANCNSDVVVSNYSEVDNDTREREEKDVAGSIQYCKEFSFSEVCDRVSIPMHAMTFRTRILSNNHIKLDEHCFYVDMEYILLPIPFVQTIIFLPEYVYLYRVAQENQSISSKGWSLHRNDHLKVTKRLLSEFQSLGDEVDDSNKNYIRRRITQSLEARFRLGFMFSNDILKDFLNEQKDFDAFLLENYPSFYDDSNKSFIVKSVRKSGYSTFAYQLFRRSWRIQRYVRGKAV